MKKYMYLCLAALSIGIFASCKAKKGVEATFSDLDGRIERQGVESCRDESSHRVRRGSPFPFRKSWMQSDDGADRIQRFPQEYH